MLTSATQFSEADVDIHNTKKKETDVDIHNTKKKETDVDIRNTIFWSECRHP